MSGRDERGADVDERLSKRFENEKEDESSKSDESAEKDNRSKKDKSDNTDMSVKEQKNADSVKDAWNSKLVYLPDDIDGHVDDEFSRLRYECDRDLDWEPKKNRHFYPVIVVDGADAVAEMDAEGFRGRCDELGLISD